MGVKITRMHALFGEATCSIIEQKESVFNLAAKCLQQVVTSNTTYKYLIGATSCPDSIAPSLGQCINQHFHETFCAANTIDLVQGCAGGVNAMILASQLAEVNKCSVTVIAADAAQKATSVSSEVYNVFKNGVFGCCISYTDHACSLVHHQSRQYKDLYKVISISLGHDADSIIMNNINNMRSDPRKHLGLKVKNELAMKLMQKAESFYLDFIAVSGHPDILILHQVNVAITNHLQKIFSKYPVAFINVAEQIGNCGCATTGIALDLIKDRIENKKVMICSFGTGGVITAGLWQF
jgi:3-oxoacyl-[acyl-carrier-protein] synthase III